MATKEGMSAGGHAPEKGCPPDSSDEDDELVGNLIYNSSRTAQNRAEAAEVASSIISPIVCTSQVSNISPPIPDEKSVISNDIDIISGNNIKAKNDGTNKEERIPPIAGQGARREDSVARCTTIVEKEGVCWKHVDVEKRGQGGVNNINTCTCSHEGCMRSTQGGLCIEHGELNTHEMALAQYILSHRNTNFTIPADGQSRRRPKSIIQSSLITTKTKPKISVMDASNSQNHMIPSGTAEGQQIGNAYHDFSRYLEDKGEVPRHKKAGVNFPAKLHKILSKPEFSHIITWMPHGRAFKILEKDLLMTEVTPAYFVATQFKSVTRQLGGWGFKRLHQPGADFGCYYHECCLRGLSRLTWLMRRVPLNHSKNSPPTTEREPDLYRISSMYPLPDPMMTLNNNDCANLIAERQRQVESASAMIPASRSVPHLPAFNLSHYAQNTTMPLAHTLALETVTAATNVLQCLFMPASWSNVAQDSTARAAMMATKSPPFSSEPAQVSLTSLSNHEMMPKKVHIPPSRDSSITHQQSNNVPNSSHLGPPPNFNRNNTVSYPSFPTNYGQPSADMPNSNLQYHGGGYTHYSTQDQLDHNRHYQESAMTRVHQQRANELGDKQIIRGARLDK